MSGANSLIVFNEESSINFSTEKYYKKGIHFKYVYPDET